MIKDNIFLSFLIVNMSGQNYLQLKLHDLHNYCIQNVCKDKTHTNKHLENNTNENKPMKIKNLITFILIFSIVTIAIYKFTMYYESKNHKNLSDHPLIGTFKIVGIILTLYLASKSLYYSIEAGKQAEQAKHISEDVREEVEENKDVLVSI